MRFAGEKQEEKGRRIRLVNGENPPEKRKYEICGEKQAEKGRGIRLVNEENPPEK